MSLLTHSKTAVHFNEKVDLVFVECKIDAYTFMANNV